MSFTQRSCTSLIWLGGVLSVAVASVEFAAAADDGITVIASGSVSSPPDRIEMAVSVAGSAELAGEAATKFRGQRERLIDALKSLGVEDLQTRKGRVSVSGTGGMTRNQYGQMVPSGSGSFNLQETVIIDMPATDNALDLVSRVYDIGKDLGVTFANPPTGGGSLVGARFLNTETAEAAAYEDAMNKARKQAGILAKLAGRELGDVAAVSVTSVQTAAAASHGHEVAMQQIIINGVVQYQPVSPNAQEEGSEASLTRQTTSVTLNVRFDLK